MVRKIFQRLGFSNDSIYDIESMCFAFIIFACLFTIGAYGWYKILM